ncbi:MAG: hypothetical protein H7834_13925 [Magnetococcus sp. YQC-9]
MQNERYEPVPFDVEATKAEWMHDPEFKATYDGLDEQFRLAMPWADNCVSSLHDGSKPCIQMGEKC